MRALLLLLCGCDAVFGLDGDPSPCGTEQFTAAASDLAHAATFSMSRDASLIVLEHVGQNFQMREGGAPEPIDLGVYMAATYSLAPDGASLFYTAAIEPPQLFGAYRDGDGWQTGAVVPRATYVGTPSAGEYGPRRLLARISDTSTDVQEYELDDAGWTAHGDPLAVAGGFAPNLTPTGLSMVFAAPDGVYLASRDSLDAAFAAPSMILPGPHRAPQLLDACHTLYTVDVDLQTPGPNADTLRSYRR